MNEGTCRSCGAKLIWAKTAAGRSMPLDAGPVADGTIHLNSGGQCEVLTGEKLATYKMAYIDIRLYKSHLSTCPQAATHRKPKS